MAYNTTATLHKLPCTDYMDFGKFQDKFGPISWSKSFFDYLDEKFRVFKKDEDKEFRLAQKLSMAETHFNQFL